MRFGRLVGLGTKIGRSRATLGEVAGEDWLYDGAEDDLRTTMKYREYGLIQIIRILRNVPELRNGHPQNEDELECVVEG